MTATTTLTPPRTLVVYCPEWPIRAAGFAETDQPVAVYSAAGILAVNAPAQNAGVQSGLRRRTAQGRCPELQLIPHDSVIDARAFEAVLTAIDTVTPLVEVIAPGLAACPTRGPSRYFGGDDALATKVLSDVGNALNAPQGVQVGIADGPLVARLAAFRATPGHTMLVPPGKSPAFLAPIPIHALGSFAPDVEVLHTFIQLGLGTLGDVAALNTNDVAGRFGPHGLWVHRLAQGNDPHGLRLIPIPENTDEIIDLDPPENRAEAVAFAAQLAAETFVKRLAHRGLSCAQVTITLSSDHAEILERRWRLDGPDNPTNRLRSTEALLAERVRWQVDGWLTGPVTGRPTAGIIRIVLSPGEVIPAKGTQLGFWGETSATDERAARAIARLEALCGPDAVRVPQDRGGRNPGDEIELVPTASTKLVDPGRVIGLAGNLTARHGNFAEQKPTAKQTKTHMAPWPGQLPSPSPTRVFTPPIPIEVTDAHGRTVQISGRGEMVAPPRYVNGQPIIAWVGPWPVEERWWDPAAQSRHAHLQVITADDVALLVTRKDRRWWLSARY